MHLKACDFSFLKGGISMKIFFEKLYTLTVAATKYLIPLYVICKMLVNKKESFGNAREMRNLLDATIQQLSIRVSQMPPNEVTKETYQLILPEDILEVSA